MFGLASELNHFNPTCRAAVKQLCSQMRTAPIYRGLDICTSETAEGIMRIFQEQNGHSVNTFAFFPDSRGWIDSIAIYGQGLDNHYRVIRSTMEIFGMKVEEISHEGNYVDVTLDPTQFPG